MNKKRLLIILIIIVLLGASAFLLINSYGKNASSNTATLETSEQSTNSDQAAIDYSPATPSDNAEINDKKAKGSIDSPQNSNNQIKAYVTITRANKTNNAIDIAVLLNGIADGTCSATLTKGDIVYSSSANILKQDGYVYCGKFNFNYSSIDTGKWEVEVNVKSADGTITGTGAAELQA